MAIKTEFYTTRADGVRLVRTYSDAGMMIERDGECYGEAVDPEGAGRVYIETDEPVPVEVTLAELIENLETLGVEVPYGYMGIN